MNIAIVDDMEADQLRLEQILRQYAAMNRLELHIDRFSCGEAFLKDYQPFRYTLIFLDVFMDGITGIETAETIRQSDEDSALVNMAYVER